MAVATPISFTTWLKAYRRQDSPIGDLARDVASDETWPVSGDLQTYETYLNSMNAIDGAHTALRNAWARYKTRGNRR